MARRSDPSPAAFWRQLAPRGESVASACSNRPRSMRQATANSACVAAEAVERPALLGGSPGPFPRRPVPCDLPPLPPCDFFRGSLPMAKKCEVGLTPYTASN
jgi:hypothetical protein